MAQFPIFLSIVITTKNDENTLRKKLEHISKNLKELVSDYELIIIDNGSTDKSLHLLKDLTSLNGLPNLQVYALTKEADCDSAAWVGLENALGDFVVVFDPNEDDLSILPNMLKKAVSGSEVVFARNQISSKQSISYSIANGLFNFLYKRFSGIHFTKEAPEYRVLSKRVVNFILRHNKPAISYRNIPVTAGFTKSYIEYQSEPLKLKKKKVSEGIERGIRLMVSTTRAPMRLVTVLSLFGAVANLVYSFYVVLIGFFAENVAPGWISISLQMSGMFFLISLVLLVLGEYILHMAGLSNETTQLHVGQEFTSAKMTRLERLNLEEIKQTKKQRT